MILFENSFTQSDPIFHKNPAKTIKLGFFDLISLSSSPSVKATLLNTFVLIPKKVSLLITLAFELFV